MNKLFFLKLLYYKILQNNIKKKVILLNWGNSIKRVFLPHFFNNNKLNYHVILKKIGYIFRGEVSPQIQKNWY